MDDERLMINEPGLPHFVRNDKKWWIMKLDPSIPQDDTTIMINGESTDELPQQPKHFRILALWKF